MTDHQQMLGANADARSFHTMHAECRHLAQSTGVEHALLHNGKVYYVKRRDEIQPGEATHLLVTMEPSKARARAS